MLLFFPFVTLLAAATSLVMLVMLSVAGELRTRSRLVVAAVFLAAAYGQFLAASTALALTGLCVQTLLAITLIVRWRLSV